MAAGASGEASCSLLFSVPLAFSFSSSARNQVTVAHRQRAMTSRFKKWIDLLVNTIHSSDMVNSTNEPCVARMSAGLVPGVKTESHRSVKNDIVMVYLHWCCFHLLPWRSTYRDPDEKHTHTHKQRVAKSVERQNKEWEKRRGINSP